MAIVSPRGGVIPAVIVVVAGAVFAPFGVAGLRGQKVPPVHSPGYGDTARGWGARLVGGLYLTLGLIAFASGLLQILDALAP